MGCCRKLSGIIRDCDSNIGGITRAFIACFDSVQKPTVTADQISAIVGATGENPEWHEYEFRKETGSVTTTITRDDANGSLYYESAIVLQFTKQETSKRLEINAIAVGDIAVIIEDNNGKFWYFGFDYPVTLGDGTAETGTAFADLNGYNITLNDLSKELPYELSAAAIAQLTGDEAGA